MKGALTSTSGNSGLTRAKTTSKGKVWQSTNKTQATFITSVQNRPYLSAYLNISIIYNEYKYELQFSQWSQELISNTTCLSSWRSSAGNKGEPTLCQKWELLTPLVNMLDHILIKVCIYTPIYNFHFLPVSFQETPLGIVGPSPHERDTKSNFKQMALPFHLGCLTQDSLGFCCKKANIT